MNVRGCKNEALSWREAVGVRWKAGFAILKSQIGIGRQQARRAEYEKNGDNKNKQGFQDFGDERRHCITCQSEMVYQRGPNDLFGEVPIYGKKMRYHRSILLIRGWLKLLPEAVLRMYGGHHLQPVQWR